LSVPFDLQKALRDGLLGAYANESRLGRLIDSYIGMKKITWRQSVVAVAFLLALSVAVFFVVRAVRPMIYWHYHQDEPIRGWMNLGYVAHSYHVPPHVLHSALGLPDKPDRRPLREIAKAQNRSIDEIRTLLLEAIVQARRPYSAPSPPTNPGASP
jgi:hypothetical protein